MFLFYFLSFKQSRVRNLIRPDSAMNYQLLTFLRPTS
jgi:hypothetical protein